VVFGLMGGVPLLYALPATIRHFAGRTPHPKPVPSFLNPAFRPTWTTAQGWGPTPPIGGTPTVGVQPAGVSSWSATRASGAAASTPSADAVSALERLAALHQSGDLDDDEYEAAKQRILGRGSP